MSHPKIHSDSCFDGVQDLAACRELLEGDVHHAGQHQKEIKLDPGTWVHFNGSRDLGTKA